MTDAASAVDAQGPGAAAPPQLLEDHGQLDQPRSLSAQILGDVDAQPPSFGQLRPERWQLVLVAVEGGPGDFGRATGLDPSPQRQTEVLVLISDSDRHWSGSHSVVEVPRPRRHRECPQILLRF